MAKAQKQTAAEELAALRDQANSIHAERYAKNVVWNAQLKVINDKIVELEQKQKNEAVANGAA